VDMRPCFEQKALWQGMLHHIHYRPRNAAACAFIEAIRGKENPSVMADFERRMAEGKIGEAAQVLKAGKGGRALMRQADYLLSRCSDAAQAEAVLDALGTDRRALLQLSLRYAAPTPYQQRRFVFVTRSGQLKHHRETGQEAKRCRSRMKEAQCRAVSVLLEARWMASCAGAMKERVYIDPSMATVALPLQACFGEGTRVLPQGTRVALPEGARSACRIQGSGGGAVDLGAYAMSDMAIGPCEAWRLPAHALPEGMCCFEEGAPDEGHLFGIEGIPSAPDAENDPERYLIVCATTQEAVPCKVSLCVCGGPAPERLSAAMDVTLHGMVALFAVDLVRHELLWLNAPLKKGRLTRRRLDRAARITNVMNVAKLVTMMTAPEQRVDDPMEAELVFSDRMDLALKDGAKQVHSWDIAALKALLDR